MTMPPPKPRPPPPPAMTLAEGAVASLKDTGVAVAQRVAVAQGLAQGLAKTFILQTRAGLAQAGLTAAIELVFMFEEKSMDVLNFGQGSRAF